MKIPDFPVPHLYSFPGGQNGLEFQVFRLPPEQGNHPLTVVAEHIRLLGIPRPGEEAQLWHLRASYNTEAHRVIPIDDINQLGSLVVASNVEDIRSLCDKWVSRASDSLRFYEQGLTVDHEVGEPIDIPTEYIFQPGFARQYEINTSYTSDKRPGHHE